MIVAIVLVFFVLAALAMPIAFTLGIASFAGALVGGLDLQQISTKVVYSLDKFPLMAIPLFMLAGQFMLRGGIMERIIDLANAVVGRVRGGLAQVTVVAAMGLSSVSGSAMADATALGGTLGPALSKAYGKKFGASLVAAASNLGPIIPPSAGMIVYAIMAGGNVSVGGLFIAGIVPGILLGVSMLALCGLYARRHNFPFTGSQFELRNVIRELRRSLIVFLMPILVIGGIIGGAFTATEGAAIAVLYALLIGFFVTRKLKLSDIPVSLLNAGIITGVLAALIAFSSTVTYLFTIGLVGEWLTETLKSITTSPLMFVVIVNLVLVVVGMFMEANAAYVMLAPLLAPIAESYGIDPLYFGFLFVMNITLGGITPPVGILLFVASNIWKLRMTQMIAGIWPWIILQYVMLAIFLLFPAIILFLPRLLGY
jgi:tripartite ATP-independent transporter DctM subunit